MRLLYSKSTDSNVSLIEKITFSATLALLFDHISRYCGPAKLTHEINHHTACSYVEIPRSETLLPGDFLTPQLGLGSPLISPQPSTCYPVFLPSVHSSASPTSL